MSQRQPAGTDAKVNAAQEHCTKLSKGCSLLLQIVGGCQQLLLEGELTAFLTPREFFRLAPVHSSLAAFLDSGDAAVVWRNQLGRLPQLEIDRGVLAKLRTAEARRFLGALYCVTYKSAWHLKSHKELREAAEACQAAVEDGGGAALFALTCNYGQLDLSHVQRQIQSVTPAVEGSPITCPNGWRFSVAPTATRRETEIGGQKWFLTPEVQILSRQIEPPRGLQLEAHLWSASKAICNFEQLALDADWPISNAAAVNLLPLGQSSNRFVGSSKDQAGNGVRSPCRLNFIAAVNCRQRFWDLPLQ